MNNEKRKPRIICGVTDMDGAPVKKTKEEIEQFTSMMSNDGEYEVNYDETNTIPKAMSILAGLTYLIDKL
jgi:hypothetical protein